MWPLFALFEIGQRAFIVALLGVIIVLFLVACKHIAPTSHQYLLAAHLKWYIGRLAFNGGCSKLAIGIECSDETAGDEVENGTLNVRQVVRLLSGGDNGVVVRHL